MAEPNLLAQLVFDEATRNQLLLSITVLLLFFALGNVVRYTLTAYAKHVATKTATKIDDFIVAAIHPPTVLIFVTIGFWLSFKVAAGVVPSLLRFEIFFFAILVLLISYTVGRFVRAMLSFAASERPRYQHVAHMASRIGYLLAFLIGGLILLRSLGVEITPLLTSMGIAGLAVALALQDTLANLFAGIWIQTSRTVRRGDYVKIEDINQEGWVLDISWRTTRIRTRPNHVISIPNTKLSTSVVSNYELPQRDQTVSVEVGVSYNSDPKRVERILSDVGKKALEEVPNMVKTYNPIVRFSAFGDSALTFLLIVRVTHYIDQYAVLHALRMRIFEAFKAEGIEIAFPHRTLYLRQEAAEPALRLAVQGDAPQPAAVESKP
jgi:small-conductance mechanosensitive channel